MFLIQRLKIIVHVSRVGLENANNNYYDDFNFWVFFFCFLFLVFFLFENDFNLHVLESYTLIQYDHAGEHSNKTMRQN